MGNVREYDPNPIINAEAVDWKQFDFKHVQVTVSKDPGKVGWERFDVSLPQSVRQLYASDVVFGPEWIQLLNDFDHRLPNLNWLILCTMHLMRFGMSNHLAIWFEHKVSIRLQVWMQIEPGGLGAS